MEGGWLGWVTCKQGVWEREAGRQAGRYKETGNNQTGSRQTGLILAYYTAQSVMDVVFSVPKQQVLAVSTPGEATLNKLDDLSLTLFPPLSFSCSRPSVFSFIIPCVSQTSLTEGGPDASLDRKSVV